MGQKSRRQWLQALARIGSLTLLGVDAPEGAALQGVRRVVVTPKETNELLANPGMGWQTFHRFADEDKALEGLPSSVAYFRFTWAELEPEPKRINFDLLERLLARARKAGQRLAFRIMCAGTNPRNPHDSPLWLRDKGVMIYEYRYNGSGPFFVPDMDSPVFQEHHFGFLRALGERYDGHPDVDLIDIGTVGLWGEWHMSGTKVPMPKPETCQRIIDAYLQAFPKSPKVMLIGGDRVLLPTGENALQYAVRNGCGWRADCLGDMGGFSPRWNHMRDYYPKAVEKGKAQEAWQTAPVAFETCWDMRKWVAEGWDVRYIFDYALNYHASYVNNKSAPIPAGYRGEVERLLLKLGYRLVLRRAEFPNAAVADKSLPVVTKWENVGVAPPYWDYFLALRLKRNGFQHAVVTNISVKGWLPGQKEVTLELPLQGLSAGTYELALAIVEPHTKQPAVRLAIAGRQPDGWYRLGTVRILVR